MSVKRDRMGETQTRAEKYKGPWFLPTNPLKVLKE